MHDSHCEPIEVRRECGRAIYYLDGRPLEPDEPLEVWTTLGWRRGTVTWIGAPHLPWLRVTRAGGQPDTLVILSSSLCRRPPRARQEQPS